ncbi:MAG: hypothetical protein ABFC88_13545 [Thermoguttaceae bacterium]
MVGNKGVAMEKPAVNPQMAILRDRGEIVFGTVVSLIVTLGTIVAIFNLFLHVAVVVSCIWLALMTLIFWNTCRQEGGYRKVIVNILGFFARKHFVDIVPSNEVRFGFQLFSHRFLYQNVPLGKIDSVGWSPGQNPAFWHVSLWFDHDNPQTSAAKRKWNLKKPDQDVYCFGPSRRKEKIESFGLDFVAFLLRNGVMLVRRDDCTFVRQQPDL